MGGELQELFKTLLMYGWVTGFIPAVALILAFAAVWGGGKMVVRFVGWLFSSHGQYRYEPKVDEVPRGAVSRAEHFERRGR